MWTKFVTPKSVIAATVVVSLVGVGAIGSIGAQSYFEAREQAQHTLTNATSAIERNAADADDLITEAEQEIAAGAALLASSEGKTLDATARDALKAALDEAESELANVQQNIDGVDGRIRDATSTINEQLLWPPDAQATADALAATNGGLGVTLRKTLKKIATQSEAVVAAQMAWQAEQDRIAAEAAAKAAAEAAKAAARRAAAGGSQPLTPSGGSTAPIAQAAPPPPATATAATLQSFAESYLYQFISPSDATVSWDPQLCQPGYICGTTTLSPGGTPLVTFMGTSTAPANYDFGGGRYVIAHEAAHVRQFKRYGLAGMYTQFTSIAAPVPATWTRDARVWPIEFMADCSTQYKTGAVGSYIRMAGLSSCSPAQLAEAALVW